MALAAAPFAAQAETWNIYGWQNHSWEFVDEEDNEGDRSYDRMNSNAGNIGFSASMETGIEGLKVNVQCEQFTFYNQFADSTASTWCNRNSKIGLAHEQMGEFMFATWLMPYNEGVAQWVDPFYDAGADSHTNIMGSMGASSSTFYNPVFGRTSGFNRRQDNIIQYWSPNWNGFVFRFAWTLGYRDETAAPVGDGEIDPVIRSSSLAYTNGPLWLAVTWQDHEDWAAAAHGEMESSDAESFRVAGRYIMDMGDGISVQLSAMWEDIEHEFNGVTSVDAAMSAFGYSAFDTYDLAFKGEDGANVKAQKTLGLIHDLFPACFDSDTGAGLSNSGVANCPTGFGTLDVTGDIYDFRASDTKDNPATKVDESDPDEYEMHVKSNAGAKILDIDEDDRTAGNQNILSRLQAASTTDSTQDAAILEAANAKYAYDSIVAEAEKRARAVHGAGSNVKVEREAWLVSGKIKFGGPIDFRFSYADADDLDVSCTGCSGDWSESGGDAWNVGLFYTTPNGTELRMTYSEVNSDDNVGYGQSIPGTGVGSPGNEIEMFAVGIVHWFD